MLKIFIINGVARSGKDTFCQMVRDIINDFYGTKGQVYVKQSIDYYKNIAKEYLGWNGEKDERSRKFLADFKKLSNDYNELPIKCMGNTISIFSSVYENNDWFNVLFFHVREPEDIKKMVDAYGVKTILVERDVEVPNNDADRRVYDYGFYDYVIKNDGTPDDLKDKAMDFCLEITEEVGGVL